MSTIFYKYPVVSRYVTAILLFALALFISGIVNKGIVKQYFPYIPCLLLLFATKFLYKTEKRRLSAIGLNMNLKNVSFLFFGILLGIFALFGAKYLRALYLGETFEISSSIQYNVILLSFYAILPQVATEEFLFRGYLFKKTIEISNVVIANIIFSILFMAIHVLDENVLQN